ncbi:hypothetical protein AURDEDRAFT_31679, partial [Auricularia subglabra TFB-10046 SS5]
IKGYVNMPVRVTAIDGTILVFEAELYVVPDMTVEVLLGEDFQLNHELNVLRDVELGTKVLVGKTDYAFEASSEVGPRNKDLEFDISFARSLKQRAGAVRAWEDVVIPAETTKPVPVAGSMDATRTWYVERNLVPLKGDDFLTVPNVLIGGCEGPGPGDDPTLTARKKGLFLPVTNPTKIPRLVRAGTVLAYAKDPQEYLKHADNQEELEGM